MFLSPGSRAGRKRPGGGTPGGANTQVQFNNLSAFGGDAGFTYAGNGQATLALSTITTNNKALNITGTWNNAALSFDAALLINIGNAAMNPPSLVIDTQISGSTLFAVGLRGGGGINGDSAIWFGTNAALTVSNYTFLCSGNNQTLEIHVGGTVSFNIGGNTTAFTFGGSHQFTIQDVQMYRESGGVLGISHTTQTSPATVRIYNTTDTLGASPTNYERGVFDWTTSANKLTIGMQSGGTGSQRAIVIDNQSGYTATVGGNEIAIFARLQLGLANDTIKFQCAQASNSGAILSQNNFTITSNKIIGWSPSNSDAANNSPDVGLSRITTKVAAFGDGGANANGWMQWVGEARAGSNFTSSNTTLTAITGISVPLQAARNYSFEAWLTVTGSSVGGVLIGITSASTTITSLSADGFLLDGSTVRGGQGVISSTGTAVVSVSSATVTSSNPSIRINGMIRVASSGTFGLTLAQSTANNAPQTIVSSGSWMIVQDMP